MQKALFKIAIRIIIDGCRFLTSPTRLEKEYRRKSLRKKHIQQSPYDQLMSQVEEEGRKLPLQEVVLMHKPNRVFVFLSLCIMTLIALFIFIKMSSSKWPMDVDLLAYAKIIGAYILFPALVICGWVSWWEKTSSYIVILNAEGLICPSCPIPIDWFDVVGVEKRVIETNAGPETFVEVDVYDYRKYVRASRWYQNLLVISNAFIGYDEIVITTKDLRLNDEEDLSPDDIYHLIKDYWKLTIKNDKRKYSV